MSRLEHHHRRCPRTALRERAQHCQLQVGVRRLVNSLEGAVYSCLSLAVWASIWYLTSSLHA